MFIPLAERYSDPGNAKQRKRNHKSAVQHKDTIMFTGGFVILYSIAELPASSGLAIVIFHASSLAV